MAIVSIISLVAIFALAIKEERLKKFLIYMVSFSTGALFGASLLHLLPKAVEESGFTMQISMYALSGILFSFIIEKFIHWRHCHNPHHIHEKVHSFAVMNMVGDGVHNLIDGLVIGAAYLVSIPLGITTTIAIILHEIPQEIGDFGVLLHGGFSKKKALLLNFLTALTAMVGAILALIIGAKSAILSSFLIPFAAGNFLYIAGSDLIPELHKEVSPRKSFFQLIAILLGIALMALTLLSSSHSHSVNDDHHHELDKVHIEY